MAGVYDDDIEFVLEAIKEDGQLCIWHKDSVVLTDPSKPWLGGVNTPVPHEVYICFVPASGDVFNTLGNLAGTEVQSTGTVGLMGPVNFDIDVSDKVMRGASQLVISDINSLQPNEQVVLHVLGIA